MPQVEWVVRGVASEGCPSATYAAVGAATNVGGYYWRVREGTLVVVAGAVVDAVHGALHLSVRESALDSHLGPA